MASILLVDDERAVAETLCASLSQAGHTVRAAANGRMALELFKKDRPNLVLLDVMMPVMDGYETCAQLRKIDRDVPIVFLTALESDADQIKGLEVGADDYVTKTTSDAVLLARIRKAIERTARLQPMAAPEAMTRTEAAIYQLLKSAPIHYFSYQEIIDTVFGEGYVIDETTLRSHISHMRRKLPQGETVDAKRGYGFRLF